MSSPAIFSVAPSPFSTTTTNRTISPTLFTSNHFFNKHRSNPINRISIIKSSASDSAIIDTPKAVTEDEENSVKVGARVRVTVPLKVYHVPKVSEVELSGKEGRIKENIAVWKGKSISANYPIKVEFLELLEGRGDKPVKFFAHLREDEFEYID